MKASELLTLALETKYDRYNYMCHCISEVADSLRYCDNARLFLINKIETLLNQEDTTVLCSYLKFTNTKYRGYYTRWSHESKACYNMRVAFWRDMIAELKEQGL
jgi:alkyl sulfatase BDS1-like metallo-beta-lactamase superfamily hydrolase